jgi:hypothetical protein
MVRSLVRMLAIGTVLAVAACGITDPSLEQRRTGELTRNMAVWAAADIDSYRYTLQRDCECLPSMGGGRFVVTVVDGEVSRAEWSHSGEPVDDQVLGRLETVDEMFVMIAAAMEADAFRIDVEYDAQLGYPRRVDISELEGVTDNLVLQAQNLAALE